MLLTVAINASVPFTLSLIELITISLSKLPLLHRMASNDNRKCMIEEEAESSTTVRKCLRHTDDDGGDNDSSESSDMLEEKLM
jgi:hypothetical protein